MLYTPPITHPAEHISHQAIGYSLDWFAKTLSGGTPRPSDDQIWLRKEIGTLIALIGFVALLIGVFDGFQSGLPSYPALQAQAIIQAILVGHRRSLEELVRAVDHLGLKPVIDSRFGFADLPAALERLNQGPFGKIVIELQAGGSAAGR